MICFFDKIKFKTFLYIIVVLIIGVPSVCIASAYDVIKVNIDRSIVDDTTYRAFPSEILIVPLDTTNTGVKSSTNSWITLIHYQLITKFALQDIPYDLIIDGSGTVYTTRENLDYDIQTVESKKSKILIGVIPATDGVVTPKSLFVLSEILEQISKDFGIDRGEVKIGDLKITKRSIGDGISVGEIGIAESQNEVFVRRITDILGYINFTSSRSQFPKNASISLEIIDRVAMDIGGIYTVKGTIQNKDKFAWYPDIDELYIGTKDGKNSPFAINGEWEDFATPIKLEGNAVLPEETIDFSFKIIAEAMPSDYNLEFRLYSLLGKESISEFTVPVTVNKGDQKFVKIRSTNTGYLNVRACNYVECALVGVINPGEIYPLLGESNGWYQIRFNGGESTGWISGIYADHL